MAYAVEKKTVDDDKVLRCWKRYITFGGKTAPTSGEFSENMIAKLATPDYAADVALMLRTGMPFDIDKAFETIRNRYIERIG